jgi:drug/metabolite transporter (DMT)-like permease
MSETASGWGSGFLGVVIFSASLPATRVAVAEFSPLFLTSARAVIAAVLGAIFLLALRQPSPAQGDIGRLAIVALGVVVGFPLLTALALEHITSARSIVFIGLLPLATALFAVLRGGERPKPLFWLFSCLGSATVAGYAISNSDAGSSSGDVLMVAAILVCGLGYAEGATLTRKLGGWQVISWALLLALPMMLIIAILKFPHTLSGIGAAAWIGLAYVSVFSMLVGFVFWYRGLALGGIARVGQLQLLQPFFGLTLAGLLVGEPIALTMILATGLAVLCVAGAKRFG